MAQMSMVTFMRFVNAADRSFRQSASSLNNIILLLGGNENGSTAFRNINAVTTTNIENLVIALPTPKLTKYRQALEYLGTALDIDSFARPSGCVMNYRGFSVETTGFRGTNGHVMVPNGRYLFNHEFTMNSTNGERSAVLDNHCLTRERVWYPGSRAHMPPFNNLLANVPQDFYQPQDGTTGCEIGDEHSTNNPVYIVRWPLSMGNTINIRQRYQYKNPNRVWKNIPGASFELQKGVRWGAGGSPVFFFSKKNHAPENPDRFHFEVEIDIGNQPLEVPNSLPRRIGFARTNISLSVHPELRIIADGS
ncbi:hypothetical protein [Pseudoalteromonas denitrificans]|uniref:Uncharacterized protein n=1 Tax=Pseudoalteromonas denitrificans DSM 6059 TaxID=1123010 RepID=A0A1I1G6U1_9GAMM|nr:hypothetical protein [Pseudoalteromonas denitrificans]SFC07437.1 hypothetical protein SAMN02745724_00843 [Pseudoalteromonas denitrificans DSM 6059]